MCACGCTCVVKAEKYIKINLTKMLTKIRKSNDKLLIKTVNGKKCFSYIINVKKLPLKKYK